MDLHFGRITPFMQGKGIIYPVLFGLLAAGFYAQANMKAFWATITLTTFTILSLGVLKVHDGFDSIFSSYERMYLALPVAVFFLMSKLRRPQWIDPMLATLALAYTGMHLLTVDHQIAREVSDEREHLMVIARVESVYERMAQIKTLMDEVEPEGVIIGRDAEWLTKFASGACFLINDTVPIVHPDYDRKTWDMRRMDRPVFSRILWITEGEAFQLNDNYTVDLLVSDDHVFNAYLIRGERMNPLDIYRSLGYAVSDH